MKWKEPLGRLEFPQPPIRTGPVLKRLFPIPRYPEGQSPALCGRVWIWYPQGSGSLWWARTSWCPSAQARSALFQTSWLENPLQGSTPFRSKAVGFCDVAEWPAGIAESSVFTPEWSSCWINWPKQPCCFPKRNCGKQMVQERISMRKIKEVLRLHYEAGLSQANIAKVNHISRYTVQQYIMRFAARIPYWSTWHLLWDFNYTRKPTYPLDQFSGAGQT